MFNPCRRSNRRLNKPIVGIGGEPTSVDDQVIEDTNGRFEPDPEADSRTHLNEEDSLIMLSMWEPKFMVNLKEGKIDDDGVAS